MARLTFAISLAPKNCAIIMVDPIAIPTTKEISANINGKLAPTAANASLPRTLPMMILSMTLYICWKIFPNNMGKAKFNICFPSFPSVRSLTY